jgi:hypothetical protein
MAAAAMGCALRGSSPLWAVEENPEKTASDYITPAAERAIKKGLA